MDCWGIQHKRVELSHKIVHISTPSQPFPQILVQKTKYDKYHQFFTMLKKLPINVLLIETFNQMTGTTNFMKDMVTKKRLVSFEDDDRTHR